MLPCCVCARAHWRTYIIVYYTVLLYSLYVCVCMCVCVRMCVCACVCVCVVWQTDSADYIFEGCSSRTGQAGTDRVWLFHRHSGRSRNKSSLEFHSCEQHMCIFIQHQSMNLENNWWIVCKFIQREKYTILIHQCPIRYFHPIENIFDWTMWLVQFTNITVAARSDAVATILFSSLKREAAIWEQCLIFLLPFHPPHTVSLPPLVLFYHFKTSLFPWLEAIGSTKSLMQSG